MASRQQERKVLDRALERRVFVRGLATTLAAGCTSPAGRPSRQRVAARRIIVVGAGLAGLVAAWELVQAGHDVVVVEARDRPGGRIETLRAPFTEGLYAEAGALFIPDVHGAVLRYCRAFDLPLRRVASRGAGELYDVRGVRIRLGDTAPAAWPLDLTPEERRLGLAGMWQRYIGSALDDLRDDVDTMTAAEFLRARGASPAAVRLLGLGFLELSGEGIESYSALLMLRDFARRRREQVAYAIEGGNDRLPRALAARLGERVRYRTPVLAIEPGERRAAVLVEQDQGRVRLEGDHVVCTIPCSVLRTIRITPPLSAAKRRAIELVPYTSVTRVYLELSRALPSGAASITTDRPIQWVWQASPGGPGARAVIESYTAGVAARRVGALTEADRVAFVRRELERLEPAIAGTFVRAASKVWDDDPWARGAYAWFRPGQVIGLALDLMRPEGCVHFAGEHASSAPQWMEGAVESALRVVDEIGQRASADQAVRRNAERP